MNNDKIPDPKKHFTISMYKSAVRVLAGAALAFWWFEIAGLLFIIAEGLGVIEEIV
jgi:hypothetical protein